MTMTVDAGVDAFIARMRARQAALFSSAVAIGRTSGEGTWNEETASYGDPAETSVYEGPALVRPQSVTVSSSGDTSTVMDTFLLKLPPDTPVAVGDSVTVTASTHDAGLTGLFLRVTEVVLDEWQICRRATAVLQTGRPT